MNNFSKILEEVLAEKSPGAKLAAGGKTIKKTMKDADDLQKRIDKIDHEKSRRGLTTRVKRTRDLAASRIGK